MQRYSKTDLKAIFKQIKQMRKMFDKKRAKESGRYRNEFKNIIHSLRVLIKMETRVDRYMDTSYHDGMYLQLGNMIFPDVIEAKNYWPKSLRKALEKNDFGELKRKAYYYYINDKYYDKDKFFIDCDGKLRDKEKYYQGKDNIAYSKEKYVFAYRHKEYYYKKPKTKEVYNKKMPATSTITLYANKFGDATREFLWSMFEYDGKALPDMERESYGFTFKNIKKLRFVPTKEQLDILEKVKTERNIDDTTIFMRVFKKEKKHKKLIHFLRRVFGYRKRVEIATLQEKIDSLALGADLEEEEEEAQNG